MSILCAGGAGPSNCTTPLTDAAVAGSIGVEAFSVTGAVDVVDVAGLLQPAVIITMEIAAISTKKREQIMDGPG